MVGFIIAIVLIVIVLSFVGIIFRFPKSKGKLGEKKIARILHSCAKDGDYVLNDIILYNEETGGSSQIDHVFIGKRGIFVIETKNYSGDIYGNDRQVTWKQELANGYTVNEFHSPVKQNKTHVWLVNQILKNTCPIEGYVVFVQGNTEHIESDFVVTPSELKAILKDDSSFPLAQNKADAAYRTLTSYIEEHPVLKVEHLSNIQKMQNDIENGICPRCGGFLVIRNGKYGEFYGCKNYPKCKFTKQIDKE